MTLNNIRLLIVEDQNVVREEFVAILLFQSDSEVVGQTEDGIEALKRVSLRCTPFLLGCCFRI